MKLDAPDAPRERLSFNGFLFPVLPTLQYLADGPDKENPDRLFIEDRDKRFLFYFEAGCSRIPDPGQLKDYDTVEILHRGRRLKLCYPLQRQEDNRTMGYFEIQFPEDEGGRFCRGQLQIARPELYREGLRKFSELYTIFTELRVCRSCTE